MTMKASFIKPILLSVSLVSMLTACGAKKTDPMEGYKKGVLPHDTPAQDQERDVCGFQFAMDGEFNVVEGSTFKKEISLVGVKALKSDFVLRGEPKGMRIQTNKEKNKAVVTYIVPPGIVPQGQSQLPFKFTVLAKDQIGQQIQCATSFEGTVAITKHPEMSFKDAPTYINLDDVNAPLISTFFVNAKSADLKSIENLTIELGFDPLLTATERTVYDLSKAAKIVETPIDLNAQERMFAVEIDREKMAKLLGKRKGRSDKSGKENEFKFLLVVTAVNTENKTKFSKNLKVDVTRTLPEVAKKAAPAATKKAGT